ncbi:N-acetylmuramoyl-L-alanine amidase [archaeon]|nr:N-acetylmuramoyl-L-alanine amidase [archaeon]
MNLLEKAINKESGPTDPERRRFIWAILGIAGFFAATYIGLPFPSIAEAALNISDNLSPKNQRRKRRLRTEYIVLHTTEAPNTNSLNMVRRYGLANYLVQTDGSIKQIIDKNKLARHVGRSMWEGRTNLDNWAIGIEVVGYHDKLITKAQFKSLKELLDQLQGIYNISDKDVIPHSMVAYGGPNRWHPYNHRGRKRCGMLFADSDIRKKLGLGPAPSYDPDVKAHRLRVADAHLNDLLFGRGVTDETIRLSSTGDTITNAVSAWVIARDQYNAPTTRYTFPNGSVYPGDKIDDWGKLPIGTRVTMNVGETVPDDIEYFQKIAGKDTAWKIAGREFNAPTTIYFLPDGRVRTGANPEKDIDLNNLPRGTEVLTGYIYGGKVTPQKSAIEIAGKKWNDSGTFYRLPTEKIVTGDDINPQYIPRQTIVFFRNGE